MSFLKNLTLGKKITLFTALGLMFGVGVFSFLGMRAVSRATETMLQDRLTTAYLVADYLDESLSRAFTELKATAGVVDIDAANGKLVTQINTLEDTYSRLAMHTYGVYLLDQSGQIIWSESDSPVKIGTNISSYPGISEAVNGETGISGVVSAPNSDDPVILLASPTREGQNGGKGVLVVAIDPAQSSIGGFVQPIRLGQTGYVEVIDENGTVVTRTDPGPKLAPFEKSDHSGKFAALIAAGKPTRGVCHTCHEPEAKVERRDVLAFLPLTQARWGVVIRQSEEEALAPTQQLYQSLLLFGAGLVTVALGFVFVTTRDIGGRIRMLTIASQRIAEGDLLSRVPTSGNDELGLLAETLDGMRAKLKTSYSELEQKTMELSALLSVSEILTSTLDLPPLLNAVVAKAMEVIPGADGGALILSRPDGTGPVVQCAIGLEKESFALPPSTSGSDTVEEAVNSFLKSEPLGSKVRSFIRAEVNHNNRHTGSLALMSFRSAQAFSDSDRRLLGAIADYIAIAIEKAQLGKEAQEARALHEVDRLRSQLISSVSHELRTPLTLIKGYSTSLLRTDVSWDKKAQQEFLQIIDEKTDELRELIDKLLQSAKLEAGVLKLEKEPVLIPRLAQRVVDELASRAKKHQFTLKFPAAFPVLEADPRCMEQVVRNLVENAIKYSPEGTAITISGEARDSEVIVSVADEGVGIPPEHKDKIFGRF
ncbi:MAG: cache domain-containing protein, partial [Dehalococcoidales bacterium]|nr:cache domain-containing protein [Dehalococcoidales bacterium]